MNRQRKYLTVLILSVIVGPQFVGSQLVGSQFASADEVTYFDKDGIRYRETRRTVRRPVPTTKIEERERIVYRQQFSTEMRDSTRFYKTPVTQYYWTTRVHGRWNPFVTPYTTYDLVPVTRWEQRVETVSVPVNRQEWVPEKQIVKVQVRTYQMAEDEVISRVAVGAASSNSAGAVARRESIGGVQMYSDPPRKGSGGWRKAEPSVLR